MPGITCPVVAYAPIAATKPSIAAQPLNLSASGVIFFEMELLTNITYLFTNVKIKFKKKEINRIVFQLCDKYVSVYTLLIL